MQFDKAIVSNLDRPNWHSNFTDEQLWFVYDLMIIMKRVKNDLDFQVYFEDLKIRVFLTHFPSFLTTQLKLM